VLIPLSELPSRFSELEGHEDMIVHCKSGVRSGKAIRLLKDAGFGRARNLKGGILAWIDRIDSTLPKY
jgi:adenylyltransferase/sulfurtransferase